MPDLATPWTRRMVLALPDDGNRYELLDGELLVTPAPSSRHQDAVLALVPRLAAYLRQHRLGHLGIAPADLALEGGQVAQPDLYVAPLHDGRPPRTWAEYGIPLLVVEVVSPSTARADRLVKRRRYQRTGVPEYWIVDPAAQVVERWRPEDERPELLDQGLTWQPDPTRPPLTISLPELFAELPETPSRAAGPPGAPAPGSSRRR